MQQYEGLFLKVCSLAKQIRHWNRVHPNKGTYVEQSAKTFVMNKTRGNIDLPPRDEVYCGAGCRIENAAAQVNYLSRGISPLTHAYFPQGNDPALLTYVVLLAGIGKL